ncbi:MAG: DEAD/DEAH box helicase, partial [Planctomycetota bacterium]
MIVDEFHHAEAQSYRAILDRLRPRFLLGLTATPERADGRHVQETFFNGRITAEVRLWDALDRDLLAPFHYFAVADGTDLSGVRWTERGYAVGELGSVYMESRARVGVVLRALQRYVSDPARMRAVGFCANVAHAEWMAEQFQDAGLAAKAIHGKTASAERDSAQAELEGGTLQALFVADLLNEGVDLPRIDTILFLRPTDSPVLFVQQLGRGLRLAEGKSCLTVLDFVGRHHKKFRVDRRFSAMTRARTRRQVEYEMTADRFSVPPGCEIVLERQAREDVLDHLRQAIDRSAPALAAELRELGAETTLAEFLSACRLELSDLYRGASTTWTALRRRAGFAMEAAGPDETALARCLARATHVDDLARLDALEAVSTGALEGVPESTLGVVYALLAGHTSRSEPMAWLGSIASAEPEIAREISELAAVLRARLRRVPRGPARSDVPLAVHGTYTLAEITVALGYSWPSRMRQLQ